MSTKWEWIYSDFLIFFEQLAKIQPESFYKLDTLKLN